MRPAALPIPPTPLIGRLAELDAIDALLARADTRLVSVLGPAGVGKTRFALDVAHRLAAQAVEVLFVPLADLVDSTRVPGRLLEALGEADVGARPPLELVADQLSYRSVVLVLDNFEHLSGAEGMVAELLEREPTVKVVVTSRRPLAVRAEQCFALEPLEVPPPHADLDSVRSAAAAMLLADRLRAANSNFQLSEATASDVARICRRVDGLPLALELAAARARGLPLAVIADALDDRVALLDRGSPDLPGRHQAMSQAISWSVDLLPDVAAAVFRRLAVCVGGADIDAAAAVSGDLGSDRRGLLDALDDLATHNLISLENTGRYRMLHVVRDVALEQLVRADEARAARDRHARFYLSFAQRAMAPLAGSEQVAWLDRLQADSANFVAAVRHAVERRDADLALQLCVALRFLWYVRGSITEARALFSAALELENATDQLRATALSEAGALARHQGDFEAADGLTATAVALSRGVDDPSLRAAVLLQRGFVLHLMGRYSEARATLEASLAASLALNDELGTARALHHLGLVVAFGDNDISLAWELQARCLALFRQLDNQRHITTVLISMVDLARARRDFAAAHALGAEARAHLRRLQDTPLVIYLVHNVAALSADEGHLTQAVRLLGAAEGLQAASGAAPFPAVAAAAERWLADARRALGRQRVAGLREGARSLDADAALNLTETRGRDSDPAALTAREKKVATLVADGLSNRAIAEALFVSERTVEGHVTRILAKLGFRSRSQIAAWVTAASD